MTVELCSGPGTATWTSDRYSVTVNGSPNYVVQWDTVLKSNASAEGVFDDTQKKCMTKWGADETVTLVVTLIDGSGPITSYELLPNFDDVSAGIDAGALTLEVPSGRKFRVHVNGNRKDPLFVTAGGLQPATPPGSITWAAWTAANPGSTLIADNTKIHFPAGEHTLPQFALGSYTVGLAVGDNCVFTFSRDAIVDGKLYMGLADDCVLQGTGYFHNTSNDPEDTWTAIQGGATYDELQLASMFTSVGGPSYYSTNEIHGLTLFGCAFHFISGGINHVEDTTWVAYSRGGIGNGPAPRPRASDGKSFVLDSFVDAGDDALFATHVEGNIEIRNCSVGTNLNSTIHCGYWAYAGPDVFLNDPGPLVEDCHLYHLGIEDNDTEEGYPSRGDQTIFACRVDASEAEALEGRGHYDLTVRNCRVYGPVRSRGIFLRNELYPYDVTAQEDAAGNIAYFTFENVVFDEVPQQIGYIVGRDFENTPHDITFTNVDLGGTTLTRENFDTYFVTNEFPYNVFIDGVNLMALTPEDGTGLADADTYATTAYAGSYLTARGMNTEWDAATTNTKEVALRRATAWIDETYCDRFKGVRMVSTQALEWPRSFAYDRDGVAIEGIVDALKRATVEVAYRIVIDPTVLDSDQDAGSNLSNASVTVGPITVSDAYAGSQTTANRFPVVVRQLTLGGLIDAGGFAAR